MLGIDKVESVQVNFDSFISQQKQDLEKIVTDTEIRTNKLVDSAQKTLIQQFKTCVMKLIQFDKT